MKKTLLITLTILSLFSCNQESDEAIRLKTLQQPEQTAADRDGGPCDRQVVNENQLAPFCGSGNTCIGDPLYPNYSITDGELNKFVNGCPVTCPAFSPKSGWTSLGNVLNFCADFPQQVSVAQQDAMIALAHTRARNYFNQHQSEINCKVSYPVGQEPAIPLYPSYRIHFDRLILPCICDENCPENARIRVWVQLGCCPAATAYE